jgi:hypothetical protein
MSAGLIDKLLDVVVATDLDQPNDDFVAAALAMLALAISKLPAAEQFPNAQRPNRKIAGRRQNCPATRVVSPEIKAYRRLHGLGGRK